MSDQNHNLRRVASSKASTVTTFIPRDSEGWFRGCGWDSGSGGGIIIYNKATRQQLLDLITAGKSETYTDIYNDDVIAVEPE